jgi:hypothetical protein
MANKILTINEVVSVVVANPYPILFIDTCSILDLIRLPYRQSKANLAESYLEAAKKIVNLARSKQLIIIILPLIEEEYKNNLLNTKQELQSHVKKLALNLEILKSVHSSSQNQLSAPDLFILETCGYLENICDEIFSHGIYLKKYEKITSTATNRTISQTPPARHGAVKDCIIYEHFLEQSKLIRAKSIQEKIVFLTSNTEDFCESRLPKSPIDIELLSINASLCLNWSWALADLGLNQRDQSN